jgi:two-component system, sensor histidine kinase and response regulator
MRLGIASRVALFVSLILWLVIGAMTLLFSRESKMQLEELMGARLEAIASTAAIQMRGEMHDAIRKHEDASSDNYRALQQQLAIVASSTGVKPHLIYTLRPKGAAFEFVVMGDAMRNDVGNVYEMAPPELREAWRDGRSGHRGRYETENGTWISGFAPIRTADGQHVALLEVDYEISEFVTRYETQLLKTLGIAGAVFVFGVMLIFWVVRATTSRIVRLTELADAISRGKVEQAVPAMGHDEVGRLATALERLRESVRTSLELLKSSD